MIMIEPLMVPSVAGTYLGSLKFILVFFLPYL